MKIALNGATTMHADLETDIKAASAAGFDLIEIWAAKLRDFLKTKSVADLSALLAEYDIVPYSINSIEHITFRTADEYELIKAECKELTEIAGAIGCKNVVVVPGKLTAGMPRAEIVDESVRVLNELADIADKNQVSLAFEFLGQTDCSVQTLDLCKIIIDKCNRDNVGLVIDSFHFYAGGSSFDAFNNLDPEKIFIFHINDAEDLPREHLTDAQRLYPGEGILPLKELKAAFDRIGYSEVVSIEIFRPEYWEQDPFIVAKKSIESTRSVLGLEDRAAGA